MVKVTRERYAKSRDIVRDKIADGVVLKRRCEKMEKELIEKSIGKFSRKLTIWFASENSKERLVEEKRRQKFQKK